MSLPRLRWFIARDSARRADDRAFLLQSLGLAAALPSSKDAGTLLTELLAEYRWAAGASADPAAPEQLQSDLAAAFGSIGIPGGN